MTVSVEAAKKLMVEYIKQGDIIKEAEKEQGFIRSIIKNHIKENNTDRIIDEDESNIAVLSHYQRENIDKEAVHLMLSDEQWKKICTMKDIEVLKIMSLRSYENTKRFLG